MENDTIIDSYKLTNVILNSLYYCILALFLRHEYMLLFIKPDNPIPPVLKIFDFMQVSFIWSFIPSIIMFFYIIYNKNTNLYKLYNIFIKLLKLCDLLIIYTYFHVRLSTLG